MACCWPTDACQGSGEHFAGPIQPHRHCKSGAWLPIHSWLGLNSIDRANHIVCAMLRCPTRLEKVPCCLCQVTSGRNANTPLVRAAVPDDQIPYKNPSSGLPAGKRAPPPPQPPRARGRRVSAIGSSLLPSTCALREACGGLESYEWLVQGAQATTKGTPFTQINGALAQDVVCIILPQGTEVSRPLHLLHIASGEMIDPCKKASELHSACCRCS